MNNDAMTLQNLKLANLVNLDRGFFEAITDAALKKIADDLYDRPGVKKSRTLSIQLGFKPMLGADGCCEGVIATYKIDPQTPATESNNLQLDIKPSGQMLFRGLSPDNPDQQVLPMDYELTEAAGEREPDDAIDG